MSKQETGTRRDYLAFGAIEPSKGRLYTVHISYDRLQWIAHFGVGRIEEARYTVPFVLQKPRAIFEGLCSDDDEDRRGCGWRCYCARPAVRYMCDGEERDFPEDRVFVAFVNTEKVVYNWRSVPNDPNDSELPMDYETRFKRRVL